MGTDFACCPSGSNVDALLAADDERYGVLEPEDSDGVFILRVFASAQVIARLASPVCIEIDFVGKSFSKRFLSYVGFTKNFLHFIVIREE